jgi:hypothetical protein
MSLFHLTPSQLRRAAQVKEKIAELQSELIELSGTVLTKTVNLVKSARKKMSASGKARIAAAQKLRWAKINAAKAKPGVKTTIQTALVVKPVPANTQSAKKLTMSAAAKAKISAAAKARWAKIKAAKPALSQAPSKKGGLSAAARAKISAAAKARWAKAKAAGKKSL